jgi:hypothetical protein
MRASTLLKQKVDSTLVGSPELHGYQGKVKSHLLIFEHLS